MTVSRTGGVQKSSDCGNFSTASTSYVDVTNLSVTITTSGYPVLIMLQGNGEDGAAIAMPDDGSYVDGYVKLLRDATGLSEYMFYIYTDRTLDSSKIPASCLFHIDDVAAGTYTYKLQAKTENASYAVGVEDSVLVAYELKGK